MVTITYTSLANLLQGSIAAGKAEAIIDHSINLLVSNGADLDNLTGDAGSKTGTYTQQEAGVIIELASAVYAQKYVQGGASSSSYNIGPLSGSQSASASGGTASLNALAKSLASQLKTVDNDPPIYVSNDPIPTE